MSLKNKHNISNPVEKKTLLNEMFDIMSYIPDMTIRTDYINMIADDMSTNAAYLIANYQTRVSKNRSTFTKKEEIIKPQIDKNLLIRAIRD
jgi:rhamnose utilization protein RhaD (predicted bifunctional aldolase and dehydrogenase)